MTDFSAINSATKYPSIPTYHAMDPASGYLLDEAVTFPAGPVILTEKIDGAGTRIILLDDGDFLIGSREELLYARGDRIVSPELGIVAQLLPVAERLAAPRDFSAMTGVFWVFYLEIYGKSVRNQAVRQYTGAGKTGVRLFDVAGIDSAVLSWPPEKIAGWRQHGGQSFLSENVLPEAAADAGVELTPRLGTVHAANLPQDLTETLAFLGEYLPATRAQLDGGAGGLPEGIVLRDPLRSVIAKAKPAQYERTLRKRAQAGR